MVMTLQLMTHHMWTAFGNFSLGEGCHKWDHPVAGMGQDNRAGPQIWDTVCTPLFDLMHLDGFVSKTLCMIQICAAWVNQYPWYPLPLPCNNPFCSGKVFWRQWEGHWCLKSVVGIIWILHGTTETGDMACSHKWKHLYRPRMLKDTKSWLIVWNHTKLWLFPDGNDWNQLN